MNVFRLQHTKIAKITLRLIEERADLNASVSHHITLLGDMRFLGSQYADSARKLLVLIHANIVRAISFLPRGAGISWAPLDYGWQRIYDRASTTAIDAVSRKKADRKMGIGSETLKLRWIVQERCLP